MVVSAFSCSPVACLALLPVQDAIDTVAITANAKTNFFIFYYFLVKLLILSTTDDAVNNYFLRRKITIKFSNCPKKSPIFLSLL
jgi:hypothetical protein